MIIKTKPNNDLVLHGINVIGIGLIAVGMGVFALKLIDYLEKGTETSRLVAISAAILAFCLGGYLTTLHNSFKIAFDRSKRTFTIRRNRLFGRSFDIYFFDDMAEPVLIRDYLTADRNAQYAVEVDMNGIASVELFRFGPQSLDIHMRTIIEINRLIYGEYVPPMIVPAAGLPKLHGRNR